MCFRMRKIFQNLLPLFILSTCVFAKPMPNAWIVQVADSADVNEVASRFTQAKGGHIAHRFRSAIHGFAIRGARPATITELRNIPGIKLVEPDLQIYAAAQSLPTGVDRIDIELNNVAKIDGIDERVDVDVVIIDTGIDTDHPDLNIFAGKNFTQGPGQTSKYEDFDGHGTHVAGIVGALDNDFGVVGVAPGARIWVAKVLKDNGPSFLSNIIKALEWVHENADQIEVANMSLSATGTSSSFRIAIQNCVSAGVVCVAAAGNESRDVYGPDGIFDTADDTIPAAYPEVVTISALIDTDGRPGGLGFATSAGPDDSIVDFSNYSSSVVASNPVTSTGGAIDLLLPGVFINSTYLNGGYAELSGTSMASPHAAGIIALYIATNGRANNASQVYAIRQALIDSAIDQIDPRGLSTLNDPDLNSERLGYYVFGDTNYDSLVTNEDIYLLFSGWLTDDPLFDLTPFGGDNIVNFKDYTTLTREIIQGSEP